MDKLFQKFYQTYTKAHTSKKKEDAQKIVVQLWNEAKQNKSKETGEFKTHIEALIDGYNLKIAKQKFFFLKSVHTPNVNI